MYKILVVDDEAIITKHLEKRLTRMGYEVVGKASSGEERIEKARQLRPDLILMDIVMPAGRDGIDAAEAIKSELDIPIIFLTAYADDKFVTKAKNIEAFGYIVKPFQDGELKATIEVAIYKKGMERQLRVSEEKYRTLAQAAMDAIVSIDENGRILLWNNSASKIFWCSEKEVLGQDAYNLILPEQHREEIKNRLEKLFTTGGAVNNLELICLRKDGTEFPAEFSASAIKVRDNWLVTWGIRDISELRAKEMLLFHADRLSTLGEMATGVAHEINQPLTIISMAAEGVLRDVEKNRFDVSTLPQDLEDIMENVKRIDRIITHMQTFARQPEEMRSVKPEEVLDNAFILLGEQFKVHDISISRDIEDNLPRIEVDKNQLEQVFINILVNARQALHDKEWESTKEGKSFEKKLICRISRLSEKENDWVVYKFADNAFGVPEELKMRVFDPFFTTKEAGQGTGLGLSIAYNIVTRSLSGRIWVEDNDMGGASFKVALPARKDKTTETQRSG